MAKWGSGAKWGDGTAWGQTDALPPVPITQHGYIVDWIRPDGVEVRINDNALTFLPPGWADGIEAQDVDVPMLRQPGMDGAVRMGRPYTARRVSSASSGTLSTPIGRH